MNLHRAQAAAPLSCLSPSLIEERAPCGNGHTAELRGRGRNQARLTAMCAITARTPLINRASRTPSRLTDTPVSRLPSETPPRVASMYRLTD